MTVGVRRPDGSIEQVRVGTAYRQGEGFTLKFDDLQIGGESSGYEPARSSSQQGSYGSSSSGESRARPAARPASGGGGGGMTFPNYGRSKGAPVAGATVEDLEFYANGARRSLNDPAKSRWHDKERELLAAIEAELGRQGVASSGGGKRARPAFLQQDEAPSSTGGGAFDPNEPPPHGDDDIAF